MTSCRLSRRLIKQLMKNGVDWPGGEFNGYLAKPNFQIDYKWQLFPIEEDGHPIVGGQDQASLVAKKAKVRQFGLYYLMSVA